jgi:hypothetical protein
MKTMKIENVKKEKLCFINNCVPADALYWFCESSKFIRHGTLVYKSYKIKQ